MKKGLLMIALLGCTSPALAGSYVSTRDCHYSRYYGHSSCVATSTYVSDPIRSMEQDRLDAIAKSTQDEKWEAFCKPSFETDEYGVRRASYARKGCDVGRSE